MAGIPASHKKWLRDYNKWVSEHCVEVGLKYWPNFNWSIKNDTPPPEYRSLWMFGDEAPDVNHVACLVHEYFKHFNLDKSWSFTWAEMCNKLRVDAFSGGACFITKDKVEWMQPRTWLNNRYSSFSPN